MMSSAPGEAVSRDKMTPRLKTIQGLENSIIKALGRREERGLLREVC